MDNQNKISVRINGKDKPVRESVKKETTHEKKKFNWILPEEKPSSRKVVDLEKRKTKPRLPTEKPIREAPRLPLSRKKGFRKPDKRRKGVPTVLKKQWLSAFSAVVVGLIMGFVVLSVFTEHHVQQMTTTESDRSETKETGTNGGNPASENLDWTLQVVQGAAFSKMENAQTVANKLKEKGYPAVLNKDEDNVYMYIGLAVNESGADKLGSVYQQNGQDFYTKTFHVKDNAANFKEDTRALLGNTKTLLEDLTAGTVRGLTSDGAAFQDEQWAELEEKYQQMQEDDEKSEVQSLMKPLQAAMEHIGKYRQQQDEAMLWQAQDSLLEAMLGYRDLVQNKG